MKKTKKVICLAMSTALALSFTGCNNKQKGNGGEKISLKWVFAGNGIQKDSKAVWAAVNDKIKDYSGLENVNLDIEIFGTNEYAQKFMLMQTSEEKVDIVQTYGLDYPMLARDDSFISIDDYIKKSKNLKTAFPEWMWDYSLVDGKHYYVPQYQILTNVDYAFATQKSLSDKYMDAKKAQDTFFNAETFDSSCWDVIENYLDALSAAGELKRGYLPIGTLDFVFQKGYEAVVPGRFFIKDNDPEHKVYYVDEIPERKIAYERVNKFFKKGYIRSDIASATSLNDPIGTENSYTIWHKGTRNQQYLAKAALAAAETEAKEPLTMLLTKNYDYVPFSNAAGGMAIAKSCENPDEAFRVIELMNTEEGKDVYNMMVYGFEGKHYNKIDDNIIEPIGYQNQPTSSADYGLWKWNVGNTKYAYSTKTEVITPDVFDDANDGPNTVRSKLAGFVFDDTNVKIELAQINTVFSEYENFNKGTIDNVESKFAEYIEKINKAGKDKVIDEVQKQINEFFKNKK